MRSKSILVLVSVVALFASTLAHADNIYVSCYDFWSATTVEKFNSSGNRTTFASGLWGPTGLAFDSKNNLYVAESLTNGRVYKYDSSGNRSLFAWELGDPRGLAFDNNDNLYVADESYGRIYKVDSSNGNISIFAGAMQDVTGLAFDSSGNLYATGGVYNRTIYKIDKNGIKHEFAYHDYFNGLACDSNDNLYVAESRGTIGKFDANGNRVTFASGLGSPYGLAFDSSGYLYAAFQGNGTIMKFDSSGNGSVFASGLQEPSFIATQVPEPATLLLLGLGVVMVRRRR